MFTYMWVVWWPVFGSDRTFTLDLALKSIKLSLCRARCLDDTPEIRSELWFYGICDQIIHHCRISPINPDISRPAPLQNYLTAVVDSMYFTFHYLWSHWADTSLLSSPTDPMLLTPLRHGTAHLC